MTLALTAPVIAPVADLAAVVTLDAFAVTERRSSPVTIRTLTGGRRRAITRPGPGSSVQLDAAFITRATWLDLLDLLAVPVLYRDPVGRRLFGIFDQITGDEDIVTTDVRGVQLVIVELTVAEEV